MTTHFELSPLALEVAACLDEHSHFYTFEGAGGVGTLCLLCRTHWKTAEEWSADSGVCPGYRQPCPPPPLSTGPVNDEVWP